MRTTVILLLGVIQVAAGLFIATRPLIGTGAPLTSSRLLDMAFAAYFLIRGAMNLRNALLAHRVDRSAPLAPPSPPSPPDA